MISESPEVTPAAETPTQQCDQCPYNTTDPARFKKHLRCHQSTAETACRHCDFRTVYSWNLDRHVKCHMAVGRYTCLRCSFSQNTRQSMTFHLQHHHRIQNSPVSTQTDEHWDDLEAAGCPALVNVEREPFIFEKHAVRFNQNVVISDKEKDSNNCREKEQSPPAAHHQHNSKENGGKEALLTPSSQSKRSREVANPANTLDGLVAQREALTPEGVPVGKRYLSEHEAIESPLDDKEIRNFETDPDVSTRTCSICGYQGKWISEMIRHKRVHTNERPFKCKYCSRTSKWKADLIRHVAKSHGIRVVSKYSRSKTFDSNPTVMRALKEAHGFIDGDANPNSNSNSQSPTMTRVDSPLSANHHHHHHHVGNGNSLTSTISVEELPGLTARRSANGAGDGQLNGHSHHHQQMLPSPLTKNNGDRAGSHPPSDRPIVGYKCVVCGFEQENRAVLYDHLSNVHNLAPYQCTGCEMTSLYRKAALAHCRQCRHGMVGFVENLSPIYQSDAGHCDNSSSAGPDAKRARLDKRSSNEQETEGSSSVSSLTAPESPSNLSRSTVSPPSVDPATHCDVCPFVADATPALIAHKKAHDPPKGLINYKCAFCAWFSKKKPAVLEHMRLHTDEPEQFMPEVERNLITPASFSNGSSMSLSSATMKK
uniref:C2H2-type domain-containing protein n=1 Tax=Plectus sambesii TaxID=2011161 RepID=A0A914UK87_9BILA